MSGYTLRRNRRMAVGEKNTDDLNPMAKSWATRVVANGGAMPSYNTQRAFSIFLNDLADVNLLHKMYLVNCYAPDSIIACTTPLIKTVGVDPWVNFNFTSSDLTVDGLKGNGINQYLQTGMTCSLSYLNQGVAAYTGSAGATAVLGENIPSASATAYAFGVGGTANSSQFVINWTAGNRIQAHCWRFINGGQDTLTSSVYPGGIVKGYYSFNRRSITDIEIFMGTGSEHGSAAVGLGLTQTGTPVASYGVAVHAINAVGTVSNYNPWRMSFIGFHAGLSISESKAFFNAIQTMRKNIGGGYS